MPLAWSNALDAAGWTELSALFEASPPMGNKQAADLKIAFGNSMFRCFVHADGKLVGVGRVLADGVYTVYIGDIGDIAVHPDYRGTGIGNQIVAELLRLSAAHKKIILYSVPAAKRSTGNAASSACARRWRSSPAKAWPWSAATSMRPQRRRRARRRARRSCAASARLSSTPAGTGRRC